MKLNVISDLHCELLSDNTVDWFGFEPERLEAADYLIVAGDTGYAPTERQILKELREKTKGKFKNILTIKGNHSYWAPLNNPHTTIADAEQMVPNDKIDVVDDDVAIIGTTLWTNRTNHDEICCMNDYRHIPKFTPEVKEKRFAEESEWLRDKWQEYKGVGKKVVIVTHHNPRSPDQMPEYSLEHEDVYTAYWVMQKALDDVKPDLWICGHVHEPFEGVIDGVKFIRHPIGYRWGWYARDPKIEAHKRIIDSWYTRIVEV